VPPIGEVQHIHFLSEHIGALFLNDEYSDVTLVVESNRFNAHKVILAARSEYFRALLYGGMKESQLCEIELKDTPLTAFKHLLRYIYMGHMTLGNQKDELILEILGLAHKYGFQDLESAISDYLKAVLSIKNVCLVYGMASLYGLSKLMQSCCYFMDRHAVDVIQHESFSNLSRESVRSIISRDSFCAPEVEIFKAVHNWVRVNADEDIVNECSDILSEVRLSLIPTQDLLKTVRPTNLVQPDILLDAIQARTEFRDMELKYRGYLIPEENVATPKHGATVVTGEVKSALLDGDSSNYDMERGFTRHPIDDNSDKGIVVKLGMQCIINHFRMLLWDKDNRSYSYYIEVSMDQKDWVRVIDHTKYFCRSWQELYFSPRVVRYIRIVGTFNTLNKVFHAVSFEAYYTKKPFQVNKHGIFIPSVNVATIEKSACVQDGVSRSRHALLNGDTNNYDWDSGYTCHQLGSGAIVVQLGQPFVIDSMKLLLWDCDERRYSYYIEVSNNRSDWEVVWDRSKEACKSWQDISFPRRPVVFIKIVGTHNTANEVFHCVHFECPAVTNIAKPNTVDSAGENQAASGSLEKQESSEVESTDDQDNDLEVADANAGADNKQQGSEIFSQELAKDHKRKRVTVVTEKLILKFKKHRVKDQKWRNQKDLNEYDGAAALPDLKSYEDMSQISQHSSPTSNSGGHFAMPMGASACSMARSSSNNLQQYPTTTATTGSVSSHRSSPVMYDNAVVAAQPATSTSGPRESNLKSLKNGQQQTQFYNSAHSLPGSVGQSPARLRAASVDDASSDLSHLLQIDDGQGGNNGAGHRNGLASTSNSASSRRVYQHALSVRVPSNNQQGMNGAVPRRSVKKSQNNNNSNPQEEGQG